MGKHHGVMEILNFGRLEPHLPKMEDLGAPKYLPNISNYSEIMDPTSAPKILGFLGSGVVSGSSDNCRCSMVQLL